jgi:plasmid maintenance system antidote protein VapI
MLGNDAITMKSIRLHYDLSCEEMADKLEVSVSLIRMIESSARPLSTTMRIKLGQAFDLTDEVIDAIQRSKKANDLFK